MFSSGFRKRGDYSKKPRQNNPLVTPELKASRRRHIGAGFVIFCTTSGRAVTIMQGLQCCPPKCQKPKKPIQNQSLKDDELALIDLKAILEWLATPPPAIPRTSSRPCTHLTALRETATAAHQRHKVLDLLYTRAHGTVQRLIPDLTGVSCRSRKTRQTVRGMQDVLLMVAEDYLNTFGDLDAHLIKGLRRPPELTLWRALDALSSHLLISDYSASPAAPGVWLLMHRAYRMANEAGVTEQPARGPAVRRGRSTSGHCCSPAHNRHHSPRGKSTWSSITSCASAPASI